MQEATVITGILLIHTTPTTVLFDFGSMQTFITKIIMNRIGVSVEDLGYELVALISTGAVSSLECM